MRAARVQAQNSLDEAARNQSNPLHTIENYRKHGIYSMACKCFLIQFSNKKAFVCYCNQMTIRNNTVSLEEEPNKDKIVRA